MSYDSNYGPERQHLSGHGCMISVAPDASAHELFAGIRLLVVCSEGTQLEHVVRPIYLVMCLADSPQTLKDCIESIEKYSVIPSGVAPTYRQFLTRCADEAKRRKQL